MFSSFEKTNYISKIHINYQRKDFHKTNKLMKSRTYFLKPNKHGMVKQNKKFSNTQTNPG